MLYVYFIDSVVMFFGRSRRIRGKEIVMYCWRAFFFRRKSISVSAVFVSLIGHRAFVWQVCDSPGGWWWHQIPISKDPYVCLLKIIQLQMEPVEDVGKHAARNALSVVTYGTHTDSYVTRKAQSQWQKGSDHDECRQYP